MATDNMTEDTQITVRFTTKLPDKYKVSEEAPVAVPAQLSRYGLSQVVNGLLELDSPRPFDFLVAGELVRQPLQQLVTALGISAELVLDVEYTMAVLPPKLRNELPHDDWVSAVACSDGGVLTGSYDGIVRIWTGAGAPTGSFSAHKGRITSVVALPAGQQEAGSGGLALTAGQDGASRLWRLNGNATESSADAATLVAVCKGHKDSVAALAAAPNGGQFASAGWDGAIHIWRTGAYVVEEAAAARVDGAAAAPTAKKRKGGEASENGGASVPAAGGALELASEQLLAGHRQCVAAVAWPGDNLLVSGSWDHSVRMWDVATGTNVQTLNHNKAVHAVGMAAGGDGVVAFGGAEGTLRIWDPRTRTGEKLAVRACASHTDWISGIAWHPTSQHHLATASHDGSAKLWDTRTSVPLHTLSGHTDKVLSVAWKGPGQVASGGADCKLRLHDVQMPTN